LHKKQKKECNKIMKEFSFSIPQNIIVGQNSMSKLPELAEKCNASHAFIISGPNLLKMGVVQKAVDYLTDAGILADVFTDVEANPSVATVEKATEAFQSAGADFLVALGGGSPMDVAKAVGVVAKYGGSITEYEGAHKVPGKIIPLIAIPTTAGSGSEVTAFSVITDHSRDYKLTVFSYELLPVYAILDATLITTAPASVAAACGIDAFIHAEESYISTDASYFSEAMSEKAMELIGGHIRRFVANRGDIEAAEAMMVGSLFAGIAFSFARLGNIHAMSHPVSAFFNVPHGVANAVLFPAVAEYNAIADNGKYRKIYNYISPVQVSESEFEPKMLVRAIRELCNDISIPENLTKAIQNAGRDSNITVEEIKSKIPLMAEDAMKSGNIAVNPRSSRKSDIEMLYQVAL
jgi:alcohol dehydrogenase